MNNRKGKKLTSIDVLSEQEWQKASAETGSANSYMAMRARNADKD